MEEKPISTGAAPVLDDPPAEAAEATAEPLAESAETAADDREAAESSALAAPPADSEPAAVEAEGQEQTPGEPIEAWRIPKPRLAKIVEALLFVSGRPLTQGIIAQTVPEAQPREIREVLGELLLRWSDPERGFQLTMIGSAYQFRSQPDCAGPIAEMLKSRPTRLTRQTLETLAIVAYRQPVTRAEIEDIRGVDSGAVLKTLLDRKFARILGKREEPGRPLIYGTTRDFLETFNLRSLKDLPSLQEFEELSEEHRARVEATYGREEEEGPVFVPPEREADDSRAYAEMVEAADHLEAALDRADQTVKEVLARKPYDELGDGEAGAPVAQVEILHAPPDAEIKNQSTSPDSSSGDSSPSGDAS